MKLSNSRYLFLRFGRWLKCFYKDTKFYFRHGFKRKEVWNLNTYVAKWILPRLKYFRANLHGFPQGLTFEEWTKILDKIIIAFELELKEDGWTTREEFERKRGLRLFSDYFSALWD